MRTTTLPRARSRARRHSDTPGAHGSLSGQQPDITAKVMQHPGGPWLIGVVGLIIVIIGLMLAGEGLRRTFMKYLRTSQMSPGTRRIVRRLGVIGTVARGVGVALVGLLVIDPAALLAPPASGGIDTALRTLRDQPLGEGLLFLAALGLVIFRIYWLCQARWRRVLP